MEAGLLDKVRFSCKEVSERATQVRINLDRLPAYATGFPLEAVGSSGPDPARRRFGSDEETVAFIVTLNAVNFGSGYFPHLKKRPGMSGYFTVAWSLADYCKERGSLSAGELARITPDECAAIFGQDIRNEPAGELMRLFAASLNELGNFLIRCFRGSFMALIEAATCSAERLVKQLITLPFFDDVANYRGRLKVHFYKRAQIMAADLAAAFAGKGPGRFADLGKLTVFADNLLPHVLKCDGILEYRASLAARIEEGELIPAGSPEEIEIRAAAVHAAELLVGELWDRGKPLSAWEIDDILWRRGGKPFYRTRPRHRTRTVFY
jgi:hypothetical protein